MVSVATDRRFGVNSGKAVKVPCTVASTANLTLSGEQTIDGVSCVTGDRVLAKDQTTGSENGIWVVDTGAWSRAVDADDVYDLTQGSLVHVNQGTSYAGRVFRLDTTGTITPGTTSLSFSLTTFPSGALEPVATLAALQALNTSAYSNGDVVYMSARTSANDGGHGEFTWTTGDQSANVAADEVGSGLGDGGIWIAPSSDLTGASGAWKREINGPTNIKWYGAVGDGSTDDLTAINKAVANSRRVYFPTGIYKKTAKTTLTTNHHLSGVGQGSSGTRVDTYGDHCFEVAGTAGNDITIEDMFLLSYSSGGGGDPKTFNGINCIGTSGNNINRVNLNRLLLQGWDKCIDWRYTWSSHINNCNTVNCNYSLRLFGQSVNNSINDSGLGANTGVASIDLVADGATVGEGLMISNSLISEGQFAIRSDNNFLSLSLSACVVDLITDIAFKFVDIRKFSCSASWVYATNKCFEIGALGSPIECDASFSDAHMTVTSTTGIVATTAANANGLTITGGSMTCSSNGQLVVTSGDGVGINNVRCVNPGSNASFAFSGTDSRIGEECTGNTSVSYPNGVPNLGAYPVCSAAITGATGAKTVGFGCTTSRTSTGLYRITYGNALSSSLVIPQVSIRRTGQNSVTWEINDIQTTYIEIVTRDAAGALFDPTEVFITIFN